MGGTGSDAGLAPGPLVAALAAEPDRVAFEHGDRVVRRGEVLAVIGRIAGGLRRAGIGPGSAVGMLTSVTPEAFAAYQAAFAVGARVVGVEPGYTAAQRAHVLAGLDACVVDAGTVEVPGGPLLSLGPVPGAADLLAGPDGPVPVSARADDVARLVYTSGATGLPKGCVQTYRALSARWSWRPDRWSRPVAELAAAASRFLLADTMAGAVILDYVTLCLLGGGTAVIPAGEDLASPPRALARLRISAAVLTVPRFHGLLDAVRSGGVDLGSLRALVVSGSPVSPTRYAEGALLLGPVLYKDYGQSENGMISLLTPDELARWGEAALRSVGRPHPDVEVRVTDRRGEPLPPGTTGAVRVRGASMMSGYWRDDERSAAVLVDGWLCTRDVGFLDEFGLLHLVGRTRDVVIVNAQLCYAGPVEEALARHPAVREAHVVGAPDERTGEAIHAFVVPSGDAVPAVAELAELVAAELGPTSVPATVTMVREVPRTVNGKPDKRELFARYRPDGAAPVPA